MEEYISNMGIRRLDGKARVGYRIIGFERPLLEIGIGIHDFVLM